MKSALEIVAFAQGSELAGISALLDVARAALDRNGYTLAAAHLDMASIAVAEACGDGAFGDVPVLQ